MNEQALQQIKNILRKKHVKNSTAQLLAYSCDAAARGYTIARKCLTNYQDILCLCYV